jgi:integrase
MAAASQTRKRVAPNLYQRGDGRYVAGLTIDGRWQMKTLRAGTFREASLELAALRLAAAETAARAAEPWARPTAATFAVVVSEFLDHFAAQVASGERAPRTLDHYRWVAESYLLRAWSERSPSSIGPDDVVLLADTLRGEGKNPPLLRAVEQTASRIFGFALRRDHVEANPVGKLERGERAKVVNDDRRVLTHNEIGRLFAYSSMPFERVLLAVLLYAGVRQGELLGLRWYDIDLDQGLIRLRRQLQRPRKGQPGELAPLKMHSERDVILIPQLAALLREHRLASPHSADADFVFPAGDGSGLHYSRMNRTLKRIAAAAEVEGLSSHVFRRTFASHLIIEQRLDVVRVSSASSVNSVTHGRASPTTATRSSSNRHATLTNYGKASPAAATPHC